MSFGKHWVCRFARSLGLRYCKVTSSSPNNTTPEITRMKHLFLLRLTYLVCIFNVPRELMLNLDETGMKLLALTNRGWAAGGRGTQVQFVGANDKRHFTCNPIVTAAGLLLPFMQVISQGKTEHCQPDATTLSRFLNLFHTHSESHWQTTETFKELIDKIFATHVEVYASQRGLDARDVRWILMLDVHSSHRSRAFLEWSREQYPTLILLFVPAGYTAWLQPLDVAINFVLKCLVTSASGKWLASLITKEVLAGTPPDQIEVDSKLQQLKNPFCQWLGQALVTLADDSATLLRGLEQAGLLGAWGDNQQALFDEARALNAEGNLFNWVNANATLATVGLHPVAGDKIQVAHNVDDDEGNEGDEVDEHPEWQDCHGDDDVALHDDPGDAPVVVPEELSEAMARRLSPGLLAGTPKAPFKAAPKPKAKTEPQATPKAALKPQAKADPKPQPHPNPKPKPKPFPTAPAKAPPPPSQSARPRERTPPKAAAQPPPMTAPEHPHENEDEYEVEKIVGKVVWPTGVRYIVRWRGWGPDDDTEEPVCNLSDEMIAAFEASNDTNEQYVATKFLVRWQGFGPDGDTWEPRASFPQYFFDQFEHA